MTGSKTPPALSTDPARPPRAPATLGAPGRALWRSCLARYQLRVADELEILSQAAHVADLVEKLRLEVEDGPLVVRGSQGQPVAAPCIAELRQARAQLASFLKQLAIPDDDALPAAGSDDRPKSERHTRAAQARWRQQADRVEADARRAGV